MRKVVDALPERHQAAVGDAASRFLVEPETDLLSRRHAAEAIPEAVMLEVRRAVLDGRRLRLHYAARDGGPRWRTVDPLGLVTVRDKGYLLATRDGADRTYRLSRCLAAKALAEPAERPERVDLDRIWRERCARFLAEDHLTVRVRIDPAQREALLAPVVAVRADSEEPDADGRLVLEVVYQDAEHAAWALWRLGPGAEALAPQSLRRALHARAKAFAAQYD